MKRELRRDSKRYKENKAKLRRQKDLLLKRKSNSSSSDAPVRKLKKITEGLPHIPKFDDEDTKESGHTPYVSTLSARISALAGSFTTNANTGVSIFKEPSLASLSPSPASVTQSIVNKLPSIGHKFVSDTKELIAKNSMKPIKSATASQSNDVIAKPTTPATKHKKSTTLPSRKSYVFLPLDSIQSIPELFFFLCSSADHPNLWPRRRNRWIRQANRSMRMVRLRRKSRNDFAPKYLAILYAI